MFKIRSITTKRYDVSPFFSLSLKFLSDHFYHLKNNEYFGIRECLKNNPSEKWINFKVI